MPLKLEQLPELTAEQVAVLHQDWETASLAPPLPLTAADFCREALAHGAQTVTSTYNEPLITSEWAVEIFREARQHGLHTSFVSNGNGTPEVLDYLRPWVDFYKVDLKSFDERHYRQLGGKHHTVLTTIQQLHAKGFWEIGRAHV